jgi:hypothetical protein
MVVDYVKFSAIAEITAISNSKDANVLEIVQKNVYASNRAENVTQIFVKTALMTSVNMLMTRIELEK